MISRIWHGYTTPENADAYHRIVTTEVIPGIIAMNIPGFEKIELFRRARSEDVEFITVMWFESLEAVKAFTGADYETAHVPPQARAVLSHFDARSQHYDVLLSRDA
ncbi:antibiotic biosynthesis monooxygenase family protein [Paracoccaceae bacterium GXU_MW_L88]